jgi:hypothetical protein
MASRRPVLPGMSWARTKLEVVSLIESVLGESWQTEDVYNASPSTINILQSSKRGLTTLLD